jgi:hypothetical protein
MRVAFVHVPEVTKFLDHAFEGHEKVLTPAWKLIVPDQIVTWIQSAWCFHLYIRLDAWSKELTKSLAESKCLHLNNCPFPSAKLVMTSPSVHEKTF